MHQNELKTVTERVILAVEALKKPIGAPKLAMILKTTPCNAMKYINEISRYLPIIQINQDLKINRKKGECALFKIMEREDYGEKEGGF